MAERRFVEQMPRGARKPAEALTIYDDPNRDRFVVSLIVGYADDDLRKDIEEFGIGREGESLALVAARAALDLTRDEGQSDTHWYVYDRKTRKGRFIEQGDFDVSRDG